MLVNLIKFLYTLFSISKKHTDASVNKLIKITNKCGPLAIKLLQFILMRDNSINDPKLNFVFEECIVHDFEHTKRMYLNDFGNDISKDYKIENKLPVASGSIGQVYKMYSKSRNEYVAIKVKHPYANEKVIDFIKAIKIVCKVCYYFNKYHSLIMEYIETIEKQLDYTQEAKNTILLKEKWKNEPTIIIPEVLNQTNNFIIMSYHDGQSYNTLSNDQKLVISLYISMVFYTSVFVHDLIHGDLHTGNWKVIFQENTIKIVLYDCGILYSTNDFEFNKEMMTTVFTGKFENLIPLVSNSTNKKKLEKCKKVILKHANENANNRIRIFIDTVLSMKIISNKNSINILNSFAIFAEIFEKSSTIIEKYTLTNDNYELFIYIYLGILERLKLFDDLKTFFKDWMNSDPKHQEIYDNWLFESFGHKKRNILDIIIYRNFKF